MARIIGEDTYFTQIENKLTHSQISHTLLGILSDTQLSAFYKSIDMLVLPSINRTEAFGLVQVEAMFQGTPVIASDLPGVRIPVRLSHMGKVIPIGDSDYLAKTIVEIHSHKSLYTNNDRVKKIRSMFDSQNTYKTIYNLLSSYVKKNS